MKNIDSMIVTTQDLVKLLGIGDRRIQQLVGEMVFPEGVCKVARGKFLLGPTTRAWVDYQVNLMREQKSTGDKEFEETRYLKERADQVAMKNEGIRGNIVLVSAAVQLMAQIIIPAKTKLSQIKRKLKTKYPDLHDEVYDYIDKMIYDTLEELSNDDLPERFRKAAIAGAESLDSD